MKLKQRGRFRFRGGAKALFALLFLVLALAEAHELAHIATGRELCGGWGVRDFSVWTTREGCGERQLLATFAGPLFTYAVIWMGTWMLMKGRSEGVRAFGLTAIFAAMPFARIFTAVTGHGDEVSGLSAALGDHRVGWAAGLSAVVMLLWYPLMQAYGSLVRQRRLAVFCGLLAGPMLVHGVIVHGVMNHLLARGVMAREGWLGSPVLVNVWQVVVVAGAAALAVDAPGLFCMGV
jgi:hypothetical protein